MLFRLYWFPLKVLYVVFYAPVVLDLAPTFPFYPVIAVMLSILLAMNIYWFVVSGRSRSSAADHWLLERGACVRSCV